jgi:hypothetical protein
MLFAQPVDPSVVTPDIFSLVLSWIPVKYQAIAFTVVTVLYVLSEILGSTQKIKANTTFQLVKGWIVSFFTAFKNKK